MDVTNEHQCQEVSYERYVSQPHAWQRMKRHEVEAQDPNANAMLPVMPPGDINTNGKRTHGFVHHVLKSIIPPASSSGREPKSPR